MASRESGGSAPGSGADLTCRGLVELVTEYLDEALSPMELDHFEAHIQACGGCAAYLEQIQQAVGLTGTLGPETIPAELRARLLEAFRGWRSDRGGRRP